MFSRDVHFTLPTSPHDFTGHRGPVPGPFFLSSSPGSPAAPSLPALLSALLWEREAWLSCPLGLLCIVSCTVAREVYVVPASDLKSPVSLGSSGLLEQGVQSRIDCVQGGLAFALGS